MVLLLLPVEMMVLLFVWCHHVGHVFFVGLLLEVVCCRAIGLIDVPRLFQAIVSSQVVLELGRHADRRGRGRWADKMWPRRLEASGQSFWLVMITFIVAAKAKTLLFAPLELEARLAPMLMARMVYLWWAGQFT